MALLLYLWFIMDIVHISVIMNIYVIFNRSYNVVYRYSWLLLNCLGVYIYYIYIHRFSMWRGFSDLRFSGR